MARRGENIHKRKDGRWEGRYIKARTPEGKIQWGYIYGTAYAEVKRVLIQKKAEAGFYNLKRTDLTFEVLAEVWLHSLRNSIKESTYSRSWFYTKDEIIYKLSQGAHEESERVQTSGTSNPVERTVLNCDKVLASMNREVQTSARNSFWNLTMKSVNRLNSLRLDFAVCADRPGLWQSSCLWMERSRRRSQG